MAVEREAALEPAADLRIPALPASPGRERSDARELVALGAGSRAAGSRAGRRTRRWRSAGAPPSRRERTDRPRRRSSSAVSEPAKPEPTTTTSQAPFTLSTVQSRPAQIGHATGAPTPGRGSSRPAARSRSVKQTGQRRQRERSQRSANTRPRQSASAPEERLLELGEGRRHEIAGRRQGLDGAVARASRDERDDAGAAVEGEVERTARPVDGLAPRPRAGPTSTNDAQRDAVGARERPRPAKLERGHALVEARKNFGMDGLQAHRDLEASGQAPGADAAAAARRPARDGTRRSRARMPASSADDRVDRPRPGSPSDRRSCRRCRA